MAIIETGNGKLYWQQGREKMLIEPWGRHSLRVRVSRNSCIDQAENWALLPQAEQAGTVVSKDEAQGSVSIQNGNIRATIDRHGYLAFYNQDGKELLREYWRNRNDLSEYCVPLNYNARQLKPIIGGDWKLTAYFEAYDDERLYGLGQYQEKQLNRKGLTLELAQRNSQASIPFLLSSRGYGFLWNNPALGRVTLGLNRTEWVADSTKQLDYWITACLLYTSDAADE